MAATEFVAPRRLAIDLTNKLIAAIKDGSVNTGTLNGLEATAPG